MAAPTAPAAALGCGAEIGQRAGRVLPDRHHRRGGRRRRSRHRHRRRRRARRARHQRSRATGRCRAHPAGAPGGGADARRRQRLPTRRASTCAARWPAVATCRIDVGCVFEGEVTLGDGVSVGPYCVLRDVTVGAGTTIAAFTAPRRRRASARSCRIGPYARLRPGASAGGGRAHRQLRRDQGEHASARAPRPTTSPTSATRRGRGRERRRRHDHRQLRRRQQAPHRDRRRCLIGSNCVLVAPVSVGDGATIGAGSVIAGCAGEELDAWRARGRSTIARWHAAGEGRQTEGKG